MHDKALSVLSAAGEKCIDTHASYKSFVKYINAQHYRPYVPNITHSTDDINKSRELLMHCPMSIISFFLQVTEQYSTII
jgi:hypothetical protein